MNKIFQGILAVFLFPFFLLAAVVSPIIGLLSLLPKLILFLKKKYDTDNSSQSKNSAVKKSRLMKSVLNYFNSVFSPIRVSNQSVYVLTTTICKMDYVDQYNFDSENNIFYRVNIAFTIPHIWLQNVHIWFYEHETCPLNPSLESAFKTSGFGAVYNYFSPFDEDSRGWNIPAYILGGIAAVALLFFDVLLIVPCLLVTNLFRFGSALVYGRASLLAVSQDFKK